MLATTNYLTLKLTVFIKCVPSLPQTNDEGNAFKAISKY